MANQDQVLPNFENPNFQPHENPAIRNRERIKNIVTHSIQFTLMLGTFVAIQLQNTIITMLRKNKIMKVFVFNLVIIIHVFFIFTLWLTSIEEPANYAVFALYHT